MLTNTTAALVQKLLLLAASAVQIGSMSEARAATMRAGAICEKYGADLWDVCDADTRFDMVDPSWAMGWTEEQAPAGVRFDSISPVRVDAESLLAVYFAPEGVWIERYAGEERGYRMLNRGFWRDCEIAEAIEFACEAWGIR